jgi:hypothetical protein
MSSPGFGQADGVMFGAGTQGGWGEAELVADDQGELPPNGGTFNLADGHVLKLNDAQWRALLHRSEAVDAVLQRAQDICDHANANVAMDPRAVERINTQRGEAGKDPYAIMMQNRSDTVRPRARVVTATLLGIIDDANHQTLYKAMLTHPSDPIPQGVGPSRDMAQTPGDGTDFDVPDTGE